MGIRFFQPINLVHMVAKQFDITSLGEILIDFVAQERSNSLKEVTSFAKEPGGAPANVSVGMAKLGNTASFIGRVGNDPMGMFLREVLHRNNVNAELVQFDKNAPTPLAFVSLSKDGERDFCFFRHDSADTHLEYSRQISLKLMQSRIFHFGSFSMSSTKSKKSTIKTLHAANTSKCIVSFDPNIRETVWPDMTVCKEHIFGVLDKVDILKVSDDEVKILCESDHIKDAAQELLNKGPSLVVITKGKEGCYIGVHGNGINVSNFPHKPLDTTGAGDGFWSGFLHALSYHLKQDKNLCDISLKDYHSIGLFGNTVGTLVTQKYGAMKGLPDIEEVRKFLEQEIANMPNLKSILNLL